MDCPLLVSNSPNIRVALIYTACSLNNWRETLLSLIKSWTPALLMRKIRLEYKEEKNAHNQRSLLSSRVSAKTVLCDLSAPGMTEGSFHSSAGMHASGLPLSCKGWWEGGKGSTANHEHMHQGASAMRALWTHGSRITQLSSGHTNSTSMACTQFAEPWSQVEEKPCIWQNTQINPLVS